MRARTSVILPLAAALGVVVSRRVLSRLASSAVNRGLALAAYRHSLTRDHIAQQDLLKRRIAREEWHTTEGRNPRRGRPGDSLATLRDRRTLNKIDYLMAVDKLAMNWRGQ